MHQVLHGHRVDWTLAIQEHDREYGVWRRAEAKDRQNDSGGEHADQRRDDAKIVFMDPAQVEPEAMQWSHISLSLGQATECGRRLEANSCARQMETNSMRLVV